MRPEVCLTSYVLFPCRTHRRAAGVARQNTGSGEQSPSSRSRQRQQAKSMQHAGMANGTASSTANGMANGTASSMANGTANGTGDPALVGRGGTELGAASCGRK